MKTAQLINKAVEVNSFYFTQGKQFKSFPARITVDNRQYAFQSGLQMLIEKGQQAIRLFQMTDGSATYRIKQEGGQWVLLSIARG